MHCQDCQAGTLSAAGTGAGISASEARAAAAGVGAAVEAGAGTSARVISTAGPATGVAARVLTAP